MTRVLAVVVLLASCAAEAPKREPHFYGEYIDPLPPPPPLSPLPGQPSLVCNGVLAVCSQRGALTRCWCGDVRVDQ